MRSIKSLRLNNTYYLMRHGESEKNVKRILNYDITKKYPLTEFGKSTVLKSAEDILLKAHIDYIFVSPVFRTLETARLVKSVIGNIPTTVESNLGEVNVGIYGERATEDFNKFLEMTNFSLSQAPERGESFEEVQKRMLSVLTNINNNYSDKNILIISHADPLFYIKLARAGIVEQQEIWNARDTSLYIQPGKIYVLT